MGWSSGSRLFADVIKASKKAIKDTKKRSAFYLELIEAFEDHDWDTSQECLGDDPAFDDALKKLHPTWFEEDE